MTATVGLECQIVLLHNKLCVDWNEVGNGREMRVHKVNR